MTKPYYEDRQITLYLADCRDILQELSGVSAVVTDPPYELGFMGKKWDNQGVSFQSDTWRLILEACLPGAMLLSFGGTRTSHRIACAIEDAGWQIRDTIMWVYGSGFPKSLDISKAIDKKGGAKRGIIGVGKSGKPDSHKSSYQTSQQKDNNFGGKFNITAPATPEAKLWEGYGTALKPAYEPIIVAMNPLDGTFADNALKHKVAGLNIDECRIPSAYPPNPRQGFNYNSELERGSNPSPKYGGGKGLPDKRDYRPAILGRFPANFIHDGSQQVMGLFPGDKSSAARFFYCAKASRRERDAGLEGIEPKLTGHKANRRCRICGKQENSGSPCVCANPQFEIIPPNPVKNNHPTVKPLSLMTYLCKLVKMPEYNLVLDPFMGSGSTLVAAVQLGLKVIGVEQNEQYCEIALARYDYWKTKQEEGKDR